MIRRVLVAVALLAVCGSAFAEERAPDPAQQALVQMVQEAQQREALALVQVYRLRAQLAAMTKRAEEAEAKLKPADAPPAGQ
ncbi:hypothetical protein PUR23_01235 [Methylorubrum populi]|uniref:hypothetical protein n=1 Tax=Methylorubrum populi TaxID=223967 RepID=UPI0031F9D24F